MQPESVADYPESIDSSSRESEISSALLHHLGKKFDEVGVMYQGKNSTLVSSKSLGEMKSNSIHNATTHSLLNILNGILDESIQKKNGEVTQQTAYVLKKIVLEIDKRILTQAKHIRNQNNHIKASEERHRIRTQLLEILSAGTCEEIQLVMNQLQHMKAENAEMKERERLGSQDIMKLMKEKESSDLMVSALKEELERVKTKYQEDYLEMERRANSAKVDLEKRLKITESLLDESRSKTRELEAISESKVYSWKKKEWNYQKYIGFQFQTLQELSLASISVKKEIISMQKTWQEEVNCLGRSLKGVTDAAKNYHMVLAENRKLYNEVQDLKGNIRVYCRIRPFLPGQNEKQTTIEYIGENGELLVANPTKQGKASRRMFKFNKVFGPSASQAEVFLDTQPLIRSVLDGYNVCIFAYGQTGSGKTYTMSGPNASSKEDWGVNYRALNDLFLMSRNRRNAFLYEIGVQMVEIYNEQVRDLLTNDSSQKRLGIWTTSQPNGLAVPEASMHAVKSTSDVLELMQIGQMNRAVGATALNERSSRSHSILTVHVRGVDLETGVALRGSLHLVDLAGSERIDRSEATGDRLKEAQHINKSLSALGDVIFALAQKSPHVPFRNSKLTQVLHSSLGGQAKTLMFVQLNPDLDSYSETISTLKFAERVSGVELGAARSNKECKDVKELMEQVASLRHVITKKDEEIDQLQMLRDLKTLSNSSDEKQSRRSGKYTPYSPSQANTDVDSHYRYKNFDGRSINKLISDQENCSEYSDKQFETGSQDSPDELKQLKKLPIPSNLSIRGPSQNFVDDFELLAFGNDDSEERLSDISDSGLSMGTETDGSMCSVVEFALFSGVVKPTESSKNMPSSIQSRIPKPQQKHENSGLIHPTSKAASLASSSRKSLTGRTAGSSTKQQKRRQ